MPYGQRGVPGGGPTIGQPSYPQAPGYGAMGQQPPAPAPGVSPGVGMQPLQQRAPQAYGQQPRHQPWPGYGLTGMYGAPQAAAAPQPTNAPPTGLPQPQTGGLAQAQQTAVPQAPTAPPAPMASQSVPFGQPIAEPTWSGGQQRFVANASMPQQPMPQTGLPQPQQPMPQTGLPQPQQGGLAQAQQPQPGYTPDTMGYYDNLTWEQRAAKPPPGMAQSYGPDGRVISSHEVPNLYQITGETNPEMFYPGASVFRNGGWDTLPSNLSSLAAQYAPPAQY